MPSQKVISQKVISGALSKSYLCSACLSRPCSALKFTKPVSERKPLTMYSKHPKRRNLVKKKPSEEERRDGRRKLTFLRLGKVDAVLSVTALPPEPAHPKKKPNHLRKENQAYLRTFVAWAVRLRQGSNFHFGPRV